MNSTLLDIPEMTPEKLAVMKLRSADVDRSFFSDLGGEADYEQRGLDFRSSANASKSVARMSSSRQLRSSSRRTSSFIQSHRDKMSLDLTAQAETKFFALMEFMASASREASSLKEYWSKLMGDREDWAREKEELLLKVDEISETLETRESQHQNHGREVVERRKEVEKLLVELSAALAGIAEQKKKVAERDGELERARQEFHDYRVTNSHSQIDYDKVKSDLEAVESRLRTSESERDNAREDEEKYRSELRLLSREHTELKSKHAESTFKLESSQKELHSVLDRIRNLERDREEQLYEKDRLQEELRKATIKLEDVSRELTESNERHDRLQREITRIKESIRIVESERDEHVITIEHLRHEIKTRSTGSEDAEARYADILLKFEKSKREINTHQEKLRALEFELSEVRHSLEKRHEEYRLVVIERDQHKNDLDDERHLLHDSQRRVSELETSLRHSETTLAELRSEFQSVTERIKLIENERDDSKGRHNHLLAEASELKEQLVLLQAEIHTITDARDRARKDLHHFKRRYEEITETITDYGNDTGELEFEIESLRTMLREAREQKERAISARQASDRERDEYVAKYEDKCRELEKWEESRSSWLHAHSSSGGGAGRSEGGGHRTVSTRTIHRSGTATQERDTGVDVE